IVRAAPKATAGPATGVFAGRWLVLEHISGAMPDLRASALVAKALRAALMAGYKSNGQEQAIPSVISGHAPDGAPLIDPHRAIAPLSFVGSQYADGHVLGFAIIPPGQGELLDDPDFQQAIRSIAPWSQQESRRALVLTADGFDVTLSVSGANARSSLDPKPYV